MARFLLVTWDGGGNIPPAFAIAHALLEAGHEVVIAGQELAERPDAVGAGGHTTLQERCQARGFPFKLLERSSAAWETAPEPRIVGAMMACPQHLADMAAVLAQTEPDVALVDCLMFGALAAMEDHDTPTAVLVHSAPGLLMAPGGEMEGFLLGPVNELRERFGRNPVVRLRDAWSAFPAICTTISESTHWRRWRRRRSTMSARCSTGRVSLGLATAVRCRGRTSSGACQFRQHIGVGPAVEDRANPGGTG